MNGAAPSNGRAFLTPPPVSSTASRSSDTTIDGAVARVRRVRFQHVGEMVHVDHHHLHACLVQAIEREIDQRAGRRPSIEGFGIVAVSGIMRRPRPAASTMAEVGAFIEVSDKGGSRFMAREGIGRVGLRNQARQIILIPSFELRERRMGEIAHQVGFDARQVLEIVRFAVASVEARENPQDFCGALRPHDRIGARECRHVELRIGGAPLPRINADQLQFEIRRHGLAGILQKGRHVVGGRPHAPHPENR